MTLSTPSPPATQDSLTITRIPSAPKPDSYTPAHHVGGRGSNNNSSNGNNSPTSFRNPWPSFPTASSHGLIYALRKRFFNSREKNFVPVPADRKGLVEIRSPDWGRGTPGLKATWIGHASFLVETTTSVSTPTTASSNDNGSKNRGIRILLDPVFSTRMSPVSFLGPKRFSPPPCALEDLPTEIDLVLISHDHYDHLDAATIKFVHARGRGSVRFICGLGVGKHLVGMGVGSGEIVELDWWDAVRVSVRGVGVVKIVCTPSQHNSGRTGFDMGKSLWCSYVIVEEGNGWEEGDGWEEEGEAVGSNGVTKTTDNNVVTTGTVTDGEATTTSNGSDTISDGVPKRKRLYFAGDTAYRAIPDDHPTPITSEYLSTLPVCPSFAQIGALYGPFDLALLPIGCYSPRSWLSAVHCAPEDSICVHRDIKSKRSIGMHYGTVRGGISEFYEDVTEPPKLWRQGCEDAGFVWQDEIGTCAIGETVVI